MSRRQNTATTPLSAELLCPFAINNPTEVDRYRRWRGVPVTPPHSLSFDLLEDLGVSAEVEEYLSVLGISAYAHMTHVCSTVLTQEFLTTVSIAPDYTWVKFRLLGADRKLTLTQLSRVLGCHSPSMGICSSTSSFNPNGAWTDLTGFHHWNSGGLSSGFIRDPALATLHKFVAYGISGNFEANKVNTHELFLLNCARRDIRVCAASFILQTLHNVLTNHRCRPTLPLVVAALAHHFKIDPATAYPGDILLMREHIDFRELRSANIITSQRQWFPVNQRHCVVNHQNALIAAQRALEGGDDDTNMDDDEEAQPTNQWGASSSHHQASGSSSYSADFAQFRADFGEWRDSQAQHWTDFHTVHQSLLSEVQQQGTRLDAIDHRLNTLDTRVDSIDTRLAEQNLLWNTANQQSAEHYRQVMDNNRMMADLNAQWSNWALFDSSAYATPPPDPDDQQ